MIVFMSNLPDHPASLGLNSLNLTANGMIIPHYEKIHTAFKSYSDAKIKRHFIIEGILNIEARTMQT